MKKSNYLSQDFIFESWYVAGWDHEVTQEKMVARTLLGQPILLYRDTQNQVVALANKCCHRAAPLSHGRREGDDVRCMYHGMKFDRTGKCIEIPGQDQIPANACVRSYPVVEKDRFIWIWMGQPHNADTGQILDFFWHDHADWRMKPGYIHYQAHYQLVVDNLLDFSHLSFVHPTTLGTTTNAQVKARVDPTEDGGLQITRWYLNDEMSPNHKRVAQFEGKVDRWQIYQWHPPAFLRMDAGSAPTGTGAPEGRVDPLAMKFRHTSVQTPETLSTTHYFFCQARNFMLNNQAMTESIFQDVCDAFTEDRDIIEGQQRILNTEPDFRPVATAHDIGLNQARFILSRRLQKEQATHMDTPT